MWCREFRHTNLHFSIKLIIKNQTKRLLEDCYIGWGSNPATFKFLHIF